MDASVGKPPIAWQPLTPRGVAAFAYATLGRLLAIQCIIALLAAATIVWFLHHAWFPTVERAISKLPPAGAIRLGKLDWQGNSPVLLADGRLLAFLVDLKHEGKVRSPAHIQVEFGEHDYKVISLLGFVQGTYPRGWIIAFNREGLVPWWGAWAPALLGIAALGVITGLMLIWAALATLYALPVWLLGFFANRLLSLRGSWQLAGAALMPGALVLSAAIFLYGSNAFGLVELAVAAAVHLVIGWVYLIISPFRLPLLPEAVAVKQNPFIPPPNPPAPTPPTPPAEPGAH
jgi:hypothetical protein